VEEDEAEAGEEEQEMVEFEVTELEYLYHVVTRISAENSGAAYTLGETFSCEVTTANIGKYCAVLPKGAYMLDARNRVVENPNFSGLSFPERLDSYTHGFEGPTLGEDFNGVWSICYDSLKQRAMLKSLLWPGYFFYYSHSEKSFKGLYFGMGLKNAHLPFMM